MKNKSFSDAIREKIWRERPRHLDHAFWERFHAEVGERKPGRGWRFRLVLVPALSAALLVLLIYWQVRRAHELPPEIAQNKGVLEDLDLFTTFRKLPVSDKEWKILLPEKEG